MKTSIERYELKDTEIRSGPFELDLPVLDFDTVFLPSLPSRELVPVIQDEELLNSQPKCPSPPPLSFPDLPPLVYPSLENMDDNSSKKQKRKGNDKKKIARNGNKKLKTESKRTSGIFVGYCKIPSEFKEIMKEKIEHDVKQECTDEVSSVEAMKEVEKQLCEKLLKVVREKCTGCQTDQANEHGHELCLLASAEEKMSLCFEEA